MVTDIARWLEQLGLGQYARGFAEHDIDAALLPRLDHELLKEIGVTSAGHRLRLLAAIADLAPAPATTPAPAATPRPVEPAGPGTHADQAPQKPPAERRQLTVMFCDLVGSTEMSARLDPELLREVVRAYQLAVEGVTQRFGGHVAQYLGDGMLVYFGYPVAHEDDAQRAVLAGLGIPAALAQINLRLIAEHGVQLVARVGIHTGPVVVGEMGGGARSENLAMGETPNLAARLQALAGPGATVISTHTRQLVGSMFELTVLDGLALKGLPNTTQAFVVNGERVAETRFASGRGNGPGVMVGRQHELALLRDRWRQACGGNGQAVALSGEAGIGKSRIISALAESVAAEPHLRVSYQCSPFHTGTTLYPVARQLGFAAGFDTGDDDAGRLDKLEQLLHSPAGDPTLAVRLLGSLLGLGELAQRRHGALNLSPEQQRARTLDALLTQLEQAALRQPLLVILEDAHWIDPTTHKLIELALDRIGDSRILLVATSREPLGSSVIRHPAVSQLSLSRLGRESIPQIVHGVSQGKALPAALLAEIAAKTDGVPLFVEELTLSLLESGLLRDTGTAFEFDGQPDRLAIPSSLRDTLMARLDRAHDIKELAQTAACIGREFSWRLLAAVSPLPHLQLAIALDRMVQAELVYRRGEPPDASYTFKHALLRDAAYDSMLKARRRVVHGELLGHLQSDATVQPQILAWHAAAAGRMAEAAEHWEQAGSRAVARSAFGEAIGHFEQALDCARSLMSTATDSQVGQQAREHVMRLELRLAHTCVSGRGHASSQTMQAFKRALAVADSLERPDLRFAAYYGYSVTQLVRCELGDAAAVAHRLLQDADHDRSDVRRMLAHGGRAIAATLMGDFNPARQSFEHAHALAEAFSSADLVRQFGHEPRGVARCYHALALWCLGWPNQASAMWQAGMQTATASGHLPSQAQPTVFGVMLAMLMHDDDMPRRAVSAVEFAQQHGFQMWRGFATCLQGEAQRLSGDAAGALQRVHEGRAILEASGTRFLTPLVAVLEARALAATNDPERALAVLESAQRHQDLSGEQWMAAEVWRTVGDTRGDMPDGDAAATGAAYERAITVAQQQGTLSWELRAACSLAAWWEAHGHDPSWRSRVHDALHRVCAAYPAGEGSADLAEAHRRLARFEGG